MEQPNVPWPPSEDFWRQRQEAREHAVAHAAEHGRVIVQRVVSRVEVSDGEYHLILGED